MNGEHARLLTRRARAALDYEQPLDWRNLVRIIYPRIAETAYRGDHSCVINIPINDATADALRDLGFIIRPRNDFGTASSTVIEWSDQAVWDDDNRATTVNPTQYNLNWKKYEHQRNMRTDS